MWSAYKKQRLHCEDYLFFLDFLQIVRSFSFSFEQIPEV